MKFACVPGDQNELRVILIHEIVHALTGPSHGKGWESRIEKAAVRANQLGQPQLANLLRKEIEEYEESKRLGVGSPSAVYTEIEDLVVESPDLAFSQVLAHMTQVYGLTRKEFLDAYPRAERVFEKKRRWWERIRREHEKHFGEHAKLFNQMSQD